MKRENFYELPYLKKLGLPILILIIIIGFYLRVYNLGFLSVWIDEYMHIGPAHRWLNGGNFLQSDNNGIFLSFIVTAMFKLFGIGEFQARFPSVIFGCGSIYLTFLVAKTLFKNKTIALYSALVICLSLFAFFMSRIARNYASFQFFYLILFFVFYKAYHYTKSDDNFFSRNGLNKIYLLLFPVIFILSLLNHQLSFFFVFSFAFYASVCGVWEIIKAKKWLWSKNTISLALSFLGVLILVTPLLDLVARPVLNILLNEQIVNWVLPNWEYLGGLMDDPEKAYKSFNTYYDVITNEFKYLHFFGFAGLIIAFLYNKRSALLLVSFFVIPFLLQSFIFREPTITYYIYYILPFFYLAIAIAIYAIQDILLHKLLFKEKTKTISTILNLILLVVILNSGFLYKDINKVMKTKEHGRIVKKELFNSTFVNWKQNLEFVGKSFKPNDALISTFVAHTNFYLNTDKSIWFRQKVYDTVEKKYVLREEPDDSVGYHAFTLQGLKKTFNENPRGWFLADYYFDNVMTDPNCRDFVIKNMDYHFNANQDGEIKVFSWDHSKQRKFKNYLLIEIGKSPRKMASRELTLNIQQISQPKNATLYLEVEGLNQDNELFFIINGDNKKKAKFVRKNDGMLNKQSKNANQSYGNNSAQRQVYSVQVPINWFKTGKNTLKFGYNQNVAGDYNKGVVIYNLRLQT